MCGPPLRPGTAHSQATNRCVRAQFDQIASHDLFKPGSNAAVRGLRLCTSCEGAAAKSSSRTTQAPSRRKPLPQASAPDVARDPPSAPRPLYLKAPEGRRPLGLRMCAGASARKMPTLGSPTMEGRPPRNRSLQGGHANATIMSCRPYNS